MRLRGSPALITGALVCYLAAVHHTGERFYEAELHRLKGELLLALATDNQMEVEISPFALSRSQKLNFQRVC